ncbi:DNA-directed RNA polymerase subunit omega [Candidatus Phytoplasma melaleucae]|uniref:DNA-directed RNA polymerase subunit omega n=1 Tax=Candidatus Phytoplasma melaleucae TaxID=2982630 RepID=A0ABT9DFJ2_9MOLU|nr:DNA-directed RNA polymerase subunit omega ['Melaleuca sp.' phytoplasma]MDO8168130.1 DNA-directed RNA polymerase subunit omega ['Melaleuca sp.' phytoplasma]MDV3205242.1 DNA-directed RNA polymerase subunit omega [Weeping tea tree witches'-broom phytoplasma]
MSQNKNIGFGSYSVDELLQRIDSKYKLVYTASKIAHVIETKDELYKSGIFGKKIVSKALSEIINNNFKIIFE